MMISKDPSVTTLQTRQNTILPKGVVAPLAPIQGSLALNTPDNKLYYANGSTWQQVLDSQSALAGDVTGTLAANTVARVQGRPVLATAPTVGQALIWNGTAWAPTPVASSGPAGGSLSGTYPNPGLAPSGVTAGSYTTANVTVNAAGQVTSIANGSIPKYYAGIGAIVLGGVPQGGLQLSGGAPNGNLLDISFVRSGSIVMMNAYVQVVASAPAAPFVFSMDINAFIAAQQPLLAGLPLARTTGDAGTQAAMGYICSSNVGSAVFCQLFFNGGSLANISLTCPGIAGASNYFVMIQYPYIIQ